MLLTRTETALFMTLFMCLEFQTLNAQYYRDYTTNIYGRQPFKCYTCTNDVDAAGSRGKYVDSAESCGFGNDFNPANPNVQVTNCYTYCLKRETGIVGAKINVERRCEPTCQEYNGNTRLNFLIDKISCCVGNYCNKQTINKSNMLHIIYLLVGSNLIAYYL